MNVSRIVSRRFTASLALLLASFALVGTLLSGCSTAEMEPESSSPGPLKRSIDMSKEVELNSNISQINQVIGMYRSDNDGKIPPTMDDLKHYAKFPAEMFVNPIDQKPLLYDGQTGKITVQPYDRGMGNADNIKLPDSNAAGATAS